MRHRSAELYVISGYSLFTRVSPIIWILGIALTLRVVAAITIHGYLAGLPDHAFLIEGDANGYWELAQKIAAGEEYAIYDPPRRILRMPGFPLLLAFAGGNLLAARLMLAVVGTLGCWFVYLLARELIDQSSALYASLVVAVSPSLVVFSVLILSETAFGVAMTFSLWLMSRLVNSQRSLDNRRRCDILAGFTGAAVTLACYFRPSWLLFAPLFCGFLIVRDWKSRETWRTTVLVLAGLSVAFIPWVVRNYRVTGGKFVVTTLWAGPSLYDGLHPGATGESDMTFFERDGLMTKMTEYEVDRYYRNKALAFVREHPQRVLELAFIKLGRFWSPWPNTEQFRRWWISLPAAMCFLLIILPAGYGAWMVRRRAAVLLFTLGPVVYFSAIHSVFIGSIRYRLPAESALCVLAGAGLAALINRFRKGSPA